MNGKVPGSSLTSSRVFFLFRSSVSRDKKKFLHVCRLYSAKFPRAFNFANSVNFQPFRKFVTRGVQCACVVNLQNYFNEFFKIRTLENLALYGMKLLPTAKGCTCIMVTGFTPWARVRSMFCVAECKIEHESATLSIYHHR